METVERLKLNMILLIRVIKEGKSTKKIAIISGNQQKGDTLPREMFCVTNVNLIVCRQSFFFKDIDMHVVIIEGLDTTSGVSVSVWRERHFIFLKIVRLF